MCHNDPSRTKDNKTVYCLMRRVLEQLMDRAEEQGFPVNYVIHKVPLRVDLLLFTVHIQTDRPSSQFWNSGMVAAHSELSREFGVPISHITEQSRHNKVGQILHFYFN